MVKDTEEDAKPIKIMTRSIAFLRWHNAWPPQGQETKHSLNYKIRVTLVISVYISLALIPPVTIYYSIKLEAWVLLNQAVAELASVLGCFYLLASMLAVQPRLAALYSDMSGYGEFGEPPELQARRSRLDAISTANYVYSTVAMVLRAVVVLLGVPACTSSSYPLTCGTYCLTLFSRKVTAVPVRVFLFTWQFMAIYNMLKGSSTYSFTEYEVLEYLTVRIRHLRDMLTTMFDADTKEQQRKNINKCIRYHQLIISYAERIDGCYKNSMFLHILVTGGIFGLLGNLIIHTYALADIMHLLGWVIALFVVCHAGQNLISEYEVLQSAAYDSKWYEADLDLQRDFRFLLAMLQKSLYVRAGPLGILSYDLFGAIVKTSYSVVAFIQTIQ